MTFAFIVDGLTEKNIVQALCPNAPVRMTHLNGKDVTVPVLAKAAATLFRVYKGRYFPVMLIVDRESRDLSSEALEGALGAALRDEGIPLEQLIISCPDRMIENWMLADESYLRARFGIQKASPADGHNGKSEMKRLLREQAIAYHEITVGVEIFKKICPYRIAKNSPSFARFASALSVYCAWARRRKRLKA
jgi:hypothetical protein